MNKNISEISILIRVFESLSLNVVRKKTFFVNQKEGVQKYVLEVFDGKTTKNILVVFDTSLKTSCCINASKRYFFKLSLSCLKKLPLVKNTLRGFFMNYRLLQKKILDVAHLIVNKTDAYSLVVNSDEDEYFSIEKYSSGKSVSFQIIPGGKNEISFINGYIKLVCNNFITKKVIESYILKALELETP